MLYWCYILHFDEKLHHAQHYCGVTGNPRQRMKAHADGRGARLTEVLRDLKIGWKIGAIAHFEVTGAVGEPTAWEVERSLKGNKKTRLFCSLCAGGKARRIPGTQPGDPEAFQCWLRREYGENAQGEGSAATVAVPPVRLESDDR